MIFHNVEQNTENPCPCCDKTWMELRAGKITGSVIGKVIANYGKAFGEPAKAAAVEVAVVELGGESESSSYTNSHMERGHEQEPIARGLYEQEFFCDVDNGGFFEDSRLGCSPDGLVGKSGMIEIKSVIKSAHYNCVKKNSYDTKYKWQLFHNLIVADREWIDFVSFCSTFPVGKRLFTTRIYREEITEDEKKISVRLDEFFELVDVIKIDLLRGGKLRGETA